MKKTITYRISALVLAVVMLFIPVQFSALANDGAMVASEPLVTIQNAFARQGVPLQAEATGFAGQPELVWTVDGVQVGTGASYTPKAEDLEKTIAVTASSGGAQTQASMYFSKLPVVYINTENGAPIVSKEEYLNAQMKIQGSADNSTGLYDGVIEIRGRGNSTWRDSPKKPYKIKLDKKTSLFGMGKNKHWVLLANSLDRSLMRNTIATNLAQSLDVMAMDTVFVDVILNGEYVGNYQLCEQIRVDETRVDIADWEGEAADETDLSGITQANGYDTTGGYLMEINFQYDEISKFTTQKGVKITFKNPEYANTNQEMMDYVRGYVQDYENAVNAADYINSKGQHYSDLFDFDDLVNYWLVCEFMNNIDAGRYSSTYFYKDVGGDLFHMGPIWDFDYSSGNYLHTEFNGYSAPPDHWQYGKMGAWYARLAADPYFVCRMQERYWQMHEQFEKLPLQLDAYRNLIQESAVKDKATWQMPTTFDYEANLLRKWLVDRMNWMDSQLKDLNTAMKSLAEYSSGESVQLQVQTAKGEALSQDTICSAGVAADGMIAWNQDVLATAKVSDNATHVKFYLNGELLQKVAVQNGTAQLTIPSAALVGRGSRNVIQARSANSAGKLIGSAYTTVVQDQYAPASGFAWPTVSEQGYENGTALQDITWTQAGTAVYLVDGEEVAIPGAFVWEDGSIVPQTGTNPYTVVFIPDEPYRQDYAAVTGAIEVTINGSSDLARSQLQAYYQQHQGKEQAQYTAESWSAFVLAMEQAEALLGDDTAEEAQLLAAYEALTKAVEGLTPRAEENQLTELITICDRAKQATFTTESWIDLQQELIRARKFVQQGGTQAEVNAAYKALQRAFNGLKRVK